MVTLFQLCHLGWIALDGNKLYLRAVKDGEVKNIDSCDVVHGEFHFAGLLDTVRMANLYMDDESIMPLVLEEGEINIKIDNAMQSVSGTPLNDSLYVFIDKHNQIKHKINLYTGKTYNEYYNIRVYRDFIDNFKNFGKWEILKYFGNKGNFIYYK